MATKEALEAEAKALEDEAEALELAGRTIAAQAKVQQAKSKRDDAQSLRSAGMFATLRSTRALAISCLPCGVWQGTDAAYQHICHLLSNLSYSLWLVLSSVLLASKTGATMKEPDRNATPLFTVATLCLCALVTSGVGLDAWIPAASGSFHRCVTGGWQHTRPKHCT